MRATLLALLLPFVHLAADAQTCVMPTAIKKLTAISTNCSHINSDLAVCKPELLSKLKVDVDWPFSQLPHCDVQYSWKTDWNAAPVVTSEPLFEHAFVARPEGAAKVPYTVTVSVGSLQESLDVRAVWGEMSLVLLTPSVNEGGTARLAITRTDATPRVVAKYMTESMPGGYVANANYQVTLEPGEWRKEITVPVLDDNAYRSDSPLGVVSLTGAIGYTFDQDFFGFKIKDNDAQVRYTFVQRSARVNENAGAIVLQVERSGGISDAATAIVFGENGQQYTVPFAAGAARATVSMPLADDALYGGTRFFNVSVHQSGFEDLKDTIRVDIVDDEAVPHFTPKVIEIAESDVTRNVQLTLTVAPQFQHGSYVSVTPRAGTASTSDFHIASSYLYIHPQQSSHTLDVTITGDDTAENDETFTIELDGNGEIGDTITLRILDDDRPPFGFAFEQVSYELDETNVSVDVLRTDGGTNPLTVTLRLHGRTPSSWSIPEQTLTFAAGETRKRVTLDVDDALYTGIRLATLELEWNDFAGASAELLLRDDEAMPTLTIGDANVVEGAPGTTSRLEFPLTLSAPVGTDILFNVTTIDVTTNASDYTHLTNAIAVFPTGALTSTLTVFVQGDNANEAHETLTLQVVSCCSQLAQLANTTATGTIRNDDGGGDPSLYKLEALDMFFETTGWLVATVSRTNEEKRPAVVTVRLNAGPARQFTPLTLRFDAHETSKQIRFYIDDNFYSGDAAAQLELFAGTTIQATSNLTIRDDERLPVVSLNDAPTFVVEDRSVGSVQSRFSVSVHPPSFLPIDVKVSTPASNLYMPIDRIVTIPPLTSRVEIPVLVHTTSRTGTTNISMRADIWPQPGFTPSLARNSATGQVVFTQTIGATLLPYEPTVPAGTKRTIEVALYPPAIGIEPVILQSSKPHIANVPATLTIAPGTTKLLIDVEGLAYGDAEITITLPPFFNNQKLVAKVSVYAPFAAVVSPLRLSLETGELQRLNLSTLPLLDHVVLATAEAVDASIVFVDRSVTVGPGGGAINVYGANEGETEIIISFPNDGGASLRVPVKVRPASSKRRSAGR